MGLKGSSKDARQLGQELGVHAFVEGSVRRHGAAVRVQARLVSSGDGFQIWAQRFERPDVDLLAVADDVSAQVAAALEKQISPVARPAFARADVLDLYLRARLAYHQYSGDDAQAALGLFEQALALAPGDARLMAGYALACLRGWLVGLSTVDELRQRAEVYAQRAVLVDPTLAEAHLSLAVLHKQQLRTMEAAREIRMALARNPTLGEAHDQAGRLLVEVDALAEGMVALRRALAYEPALLTATRDLSRAHALIGEWDQSMALTPRKGPVDLAGVARLKLWRERRTEAWDFLRGQSSHPVMAEAIRVVLDGSPVPDRVALQGIRVVTFFQQVRCEYLAVRGKPGDTADAMAHLEQLVAAGHIDLSWMRRCPALDSLRHEPRFADLTTIVEQLAAPVRAVLLGG
jgi:serine/threonine-protein kinase